MMSLLLIQKITQRHLLRIYTTGVVIYTSLFFKFFLCAAIFILFILVLKNLPV